MTTTVSTLSNGLRIVTDRMDHVETASLGVWVGAGTRHETEAVNGVSHLLEHMAFKGTARRNPAEIAIAIENVGGIINAYTSREQTAYYAKVLADDAPLALDVIGDIICNSTFPEDELERERQVILQEIGQAADMPEDVAFDTFQAIAYPDQAAGRTVLGDPQVVRNLPRADMIAYMHARYRPSRLVLAAAGKVDHDAFVRAVEAQFGHWQPGESEAPEPARYKGGYAKVAREGEQAHMILGFPALSYLHEDFYGLQVLSTLFGGGMSSRLFQEVREKRGLVYSIYSFASGMLDHGVFGIYAGSGPETAHEVCEIVTRECRNLSGSVTEEEVARARAQLKAQILMARESTGQRAEQAATQLLAFGRRREVEEIVARV
ncbi:MAG: insulinase family protein, partial [Alphaproteobacteria bacterium]|nr:insulinase family protein [Alphaproteobacteria bacterium]